MKKMIFGLGVLTLLAMSNACAETVTCESKKGQRNECDMNTRGEVRIVRQLSKARCTEGVTWGLSKHTVWVEGGCRAVFENVSGGGFTSAPGATGIPLLNADCPGGTSVHADQGGPVYVNGKEAQLKRFNNNYYEARDAASGTVVSLSRNPDGTMGVSYTGRGGANGMCQIR